MSLLMCSTRCIHMCVRTYNTQREHMIHKENTLYTKRTHYTHVHMIHMTHAYVWHDSCICVTWLMHMCDMTHAYVWCRTKTRRMLARHGTTNVFHMTHAYVWHDSCICVTWLMSHTYEWVMSYMWLSHVTHMDESWHACNWVMSHIE